MRVEPSRCLLVLGEREAVTGVVGQLELLPEGVGGGKEEEKAAAEAVRSVSR